MPAKWTHLFGKRILKGQHKVTNGKHYNRGLGNILVNFPNQIQLFIIFLHLQTKTDWIYCLCSKDFKHWIIPLCVYVNHLFHSYTHFQIRHLSLNRVKPKYKQGRNGVSTFQVYCSMLLGIFRTEWDICTYVLLFTEHLVVKEYVYCM